ncbi:MAG: outer membrane beta-barrel domain-containing protein [Myxococcota bacterium]|nr:outer membrane beta-barrel domain-containing protein [Myxococcota bacterium]
MLRPLIVLMALTFASSEALAQITSNKPKPAPVPTSTDKDDDKETDSPADPVFGEPVTGIDGVEVGGIDIDRSPRVKVTEDESIYVAQRRAYTKKNGFEITPYFVTAMNPKFVGYLGAGLSLAYHVRENFAVEFTTSIPYAFIPFYSALVIDVRQYENLSPQDVDLKQMDYFGALSAQFSAFYGKLEFYDNLLDYDFYVTVGAGLSTTLKTCALAAGNTTTQECTNTTQVPGLGTRRPDEGVDSYKIAGHVGGGFRFFFSEMFGLRVEIRDIVYADRDQ